MFRQNPLHPRPKEHNQFAVLDETRKVHGTLGPAIHVTFREAEAKQFAKITPHSRVVELRYPRQKAEI